MELSTPEAAKLANVSEGAVRSWCRKGLVQHRRIGLRDKYLIDQQDFVRLATELGYITQQPEE